MVLGSTQPLTEMSTRCISWGVKGGQCVRLTTLPPSCAVVMKSGDLDFLEPSGPLQACNGTALPLPCSHDNFKIYCNSHILWKCSLILYLHGQIYGFNLQTDRCDLLIMLCLDTLFPWNT